MKTMKKMLCVAALALVGIPPSVCGSDLSLTTASDYVYTKPNCPNLLKGKGIRATVTRNGRAVATNAVAYYALRAEDLAFLRESTVEKYHLMTGYTNHSGVVDSYDVRPGTENLWDNNILCVEEYEGKWDDGEGGTYENSGRDYKYRVGYVDQDGTFGAAFVKIPDPPHRDTRGLRLFNWDVTINGETFDAMSITYRTANESSPTPMLEYLFQNWETMEKGEVEYDWYDDPTNYEKYVYTTWYGKSTNSTENPILPVTLQGVPCVSNILQWYKSLDGLNRLAIPFKDTSGEVLLNHSLFDKDYNKIKVVNDDYVRTVVASTELVFTTNEWTHVVTTNFNPKTSYAKTIDPEREYADPKTFQIFTKAYDVAAVITTNDYGIGEDDSIMIRNQQYRLGRYANPTNFATKLFWKDINLVCHTNYHDTLIFPNTLVDKRPFSRPIYKRQFKNCKAIATYGVICQCNDATNDVIFCRTNVVCEVADATYDGSNFCWNAATTLATVKEMLNGIPTVEPQLSFPTSAYAQDDVDWLDPIKKVGVYANTDALVHDDHYEMWMWKDYTIYICALPLSAWVVVDVEGNAREL